MEISEEGWKEARMRSLKGEAGEGESSLSIDFKFRKFCYMEGGLGIRVRREVRVCFVYC